MFVKFVTNPHIYWVRTDFTTISKINFLLNSYVFHEFFDEFASDLNEFCFKNIGKNLALYRFIMPILTQ